MDNTLEASAQRFLKLATRLRRLGADAPVSDGALISPSHLALLEYVATFPGCGVQEIADGLKLSPPTVSVGVRQLEKMDWLARQPHPDDRRAIQLFLTSTGEDVYRRAHAFHRRKFGRLLQGLTPEERDTLLTLLERAVNAAESSEK
ncbi:MAG: MarR family transcriptional regulator [Chloroflexi bacterium]|nr:MarR family transcriptional regulator [Chloroflexota bacterium]